MTKRDAEYARANARLGNRKLALRKELRKLPDADLLRRLGKYQGRTLSEMKVEYRFDTSWPRRDLVIDLIVANEVKP